VPQGVHVGPAAPLAFVPHLRRLGTEGMDGGIGPKNVWGEGGGGLAPDDASPNFQFSVTCERESFTLK